MNYLDYKRWFDIESSRLKIPEDCCADKFATFDVTSSTFWTVRGYLTFTDSKYIRIWEHYRKKAGMQDSYRARFVFHYGMCLKFDQDKTPLYESSDPVDIRIDDVHGPVHIHYAGPNPHYPQDQVKGLDLDSVDMFTFITGILKHRKTAKPLSDLLGFELVA